MKSEEKDDTKQNEKKFFINGFLYCYSTDKFIYLKQKLVSILFILFLFISSFTSAQSPTFYAQVSKNKVAVGEVFQVAFTINGAANNLVYPNLKDFDVYSGPNQSQSMTMVNGNISQSTTVSLFIAARKDGKFTIGVATVMFGNQKLESKPIIIEVIKSGNKQQSGGNTNANAQPSNAQPQKAEKNQYATEVSNEDLFVRTYLSKTKCFLGEQITLTQKVYSRVDLRGFQNVKFPPYNGFWSQQENTDQQINLQQENVNGVNYYVADYNKVYLFPQRNGTITIDPVELDCIVRRQTKAQPRNIFEQFFGASGYEDIAIKVKSKAVKVEVKDLPTEGKPEEFSGAVGSFTYKAQLSKNEVRANDAVNLKLTITGKGNIKLVEPLKLQLPENFESYEPKVNETIKTIGGVSGNKTYDYLIIPRQKGEYVLSNLNFSYFDADKKQYVVLPSPDIKLNVLEGEAGSAQIISPTKKGINESENDIRYIKTGDLDLQTNKPEFFSSLTHYLLLIFPSLIFIGAVFLVKKRIQDNSDITALKERKAAKIAIKQLSIAEKYMRANNKDLFFTEILNALHKYIGDKFGLSIADLSKEKISGMLLQRNVSQQTTSHVIDTLNTCEYAKYAPSSVTGDLKLVYNDTVKLISEIENQIKNKLLFLLP